MRVLVLSHMYPSRFNEIFGIFIHEQVKALVSKGVQVQVVAPVPWSPFPINYLSPRWKKYSKIPTKSIRDGITLWHPRYLVFPRSWALSSSGKRMYYGIRQVISRIYKAFPFDLIHAHVALPDGYAGMLLARDYQKPFVVTIHGQDLHRTVFASNRSRRALQQVFSQANKIIVVSTKLEKLAKQYFGQDLPLVVIHNGFSVEKILHTKKRKSTQWRQKRIILSVSNLVHTKGLDLNILAFSYLADKYQNLFYVIVGDGPMRGQLQTLVHKLKLEDRIIFVGQQPHAKVMEYLVDCEIFSLPSWQEGFGIVYLEAMAHGKPVIACRGEGPEDFIDHGQTGMLVAPRDVDSLVEALDFLLSHPKEAKAMGERAREMVLKNFSWTKTAERIIAVYSEILSEISNTKF